MSADVPVDPLIALRLFADMRKARLALRGLDDTDPATRARLIRDPEIYHALSTLLHAAEKLVSTPDEDVLFWHPRRETRSVAEKRFDKLRAEFSRPVAKSKQEIGNEV